MDLGAGDDMTTSLLVSSNGGAYSTGGLTGAVDDVVRLRSSDTSAASYRFEILSYPSGFTCPSGWSTGTGSVYYYVTYKTPPDVTLATWGKYLFRLTLNGGLRNGVADSTLIDSLTGVDVVSPARGLHQVAAYETTQWSATSGWTSAINDALTKLERSWVFLAEDIDPGEVAANATLDVVVTVADAIGTECVHVCPVTELEDGLSVSVVLVAAGEITLRWMNCTAAPINPASNDYRIGLTRS